MLVTLTTIFLLLLVDKSDFSRLAASVNLPTCIKLTVVFHSAGDQQKV